MIQMVIKILLVDDSLKFLDAARKFLGTVPGVKVIGTATSGGDGVRLTTELYPDLVLMDVKIAGMSGIEAARSIKRLQHPPHIILLTLHDAPEYQTAAVAVGVDGVVSKTNFGTQLVPEICKLFDVGVHEISAGS